MEVIGFSSIGALKPYYLSPWTLRVVHGSWGGRPMGSLPCISEGLANDLGLKGPASDFLNPKQEK